MGTDLYGNLTEPFNSQVGDFALPVIIVLFWKAFSIESQNQTRGSAKYLSDQTISLESYRFQTAWGGGSCGTPPKVIDVLVILRQKQQMKLPTSWGSRIRKSCRIEFLTPFCNQKRYFAFFSFWLDKMVMNQKQQMKLPTISGLRIRKFYRIEFLTLFVTQNGIWCFSAFSLIKWS